LAKVVFAGAGIAEQHRARRRGGEAVTDSRDSRSDSMTAFSWEARGGAAFCGISRGAYRAQCRWRRAEASVLGLSGGLAVDARQVQERGIADDLVQVVPEQGLRVGLAWRPCFRKTVQCWWMFRVWTLPKANRPARCSWRGDRLAPGCGFMAGNSGEELRRAFTQQTLDAGLAPMVNGQC